MSDHDIRAMLDELNESARLWNLERLKYDAELDAEITELNESTRLWELERQKREKNEKNRIDALITQTNESDRPALMEKLEYERKKRQGVLERGEMSVIIMSGEPRESIGGMVTILDNPEKWRKKETDKAKAKTLLDNPTDENMEEFYNMLSNMHKKIVKTTLDNSSETS